MRPERRCLTEAVVTTQTERLTFAAFGVVVEVRLPARLYKDALALLPPGAERREAAPAMARVKVAEVDGWLEVSSEGVRTDAALDDGFALGMLDARIRANIALLAPEHIFVHAGTVAVDGGAIVLPGYTFAGKTTLVRALIEAGATYYSDEFAVLDAAGLVHPYPKPLSVRNPDISGRTTETPAATLGGATGTHPAPLRLVAATRFRSGATLEPEALNQGAALLALLGHTIPARTRPRQSLATLKAALTGARAWRSDRSEATPAAHAIIQSVRLTRPPLG